MNVNTIESTDNPERVVCTAARGDYYDGYVGETSYRELMEDVVYKDRHVEDVAEINGYEASEGDVNGDVISPETELLAKQYKLLERLFRRGHWGVWEHPQITLGIKGISRSCMAQLTRHRQSSFDVQSQRYVDFSEKDDPVSTPKSLVDEEHFSRETGAVDVDDDSRKDMREEFEGYVEDVVEIYEDMVDNDIPKEDARFILPIGTKVNMTMSVNARTLLHISNLREKANSQWEIRQLTTKVLDEEFKDWMPMTYNLWREHGPTDISP